MSPSDPEKAVASPDWNSDTPSIEMARFKAGVVSAAGAALLRKLSTVDSQSLDVSAEAIAGIEANAAPTPNPTASNPSRVKARVLFIDLPFPQNANWRLYRDQRPTALCRPKLMRSR